MALAPRLFVFLLRLRIGVFANAEKCGFTLSQVDHPCVLLYWIRLGHRHHLDSVQWCWLFRAGHWAQGQPSREAYRHSHAAG